MFTDIQLFANQQAKIARYFQIVFLALYKLFIDDGLEISDQKELINLLNKAGDNTITLSAGGGNWSAKEKQTQIDALWGVLQKCFIKSEDNDPSRNQWITRFENILMQSSTEQTLYDFKVGLHNLVPNTDFNQDLFSKIIKTLTAMANTLSNATGYVIIGVADEERTGKNHNSVYSNNYIKYSNFYITGINDEAKTYHIDVDKYFTKLSQLIQNEPISERDKDNIARNITIINYFDKTLVIFKIETGDKPSVYNSKYYVRNGSNNSEVKPENFSELFERFN